MIGIQIIARLGSTRLKRKHLIKALDKTFLEWLILRIQNEFINEITLKEIKIFISTSDEIENKEFEQLKEKLNVDVFYGSINNIPLRLLECSKANDLKGIISIDGDDILSSTKAIRIIYDSLKIYKNEFIKTSGLPLGMNISGFNSHFLEKIIENNLNQINFETGWGVLFEPYNSINYQFKFSNISEIRATLDYKEDALFFLSIIEQLQDRVITIKDTDLIKFIIENKIYKINSSLNDEYWRNFNNEKKRK